MQARSGLLGVSFAVLAALKKAVQATLDTRGAILSTMLAHGNQSLFLLFGNKGLTPEPSWIELSAIPLPLRRLRTLR